MAEKIRTTVVLGDEFDDSSRHMILNVLSEMGALFVDYGGRAVAGSQEVEALRVLIDGQELNVEAETYAGLSISGPEPPRFSWRLFGLSHAAIGTAGLTSCR